MFNFKYLGEILYEIFLKAYSLVAKIVWFLPHDIRVTFSCFIALSYQFYKYEYIIRLDLIFHKKHLLRDCDFKK
jgi:hypothetical protein